MPISQFLGNSKFDPETKRIMGLAFEMTRLALGVPDRGDIANELIAKRIIELAKAGERNPDLLCESAVISQAVANVGVTQGARRREHLPRPGVAQAEPCFQPGSIERP
jgi:hypothetical protein